MFKRMIMSAFVLTALVGNAWAEAKQNFTLKNRTGYTISEVYVSPAKSDDWEEDILGRDVLSEGERVDITFSRKEKSCIWDLKVVYDDGTPAEWEGFNLCEVSTISIFYDRKKDQTWAEYN
ncbi:MULTISPECIES: argininosuccinate lyase [unclassified Azospirillum]|uniref:argininosuccinate lyase n=1 Tax=unclassified Azospirillum TaxID=2630922 RepID=UPI000B6E9FB8|nr:MULTISPECIES: argininosuccinate lyase [unclassified Azospirillum]SNR99527.1 hypothetical protein SAMN05880556_101997 [Azospirillum sp. RU38E]SNS17025.1 hypothetical protein SAMN05880591_101997 [Azospirillum sp. RU37A]